jgi:hypothetical protein
MLGRLDGQVYVEVGPVKVARTNKPYVGDLGYRRVAEPGELIERQKAVLT